VARDAIARQFDVDKNSVVMDQKARTITFFAKKGKSIDVEKLFASLQATRMSGRTGNSLESLVLVATGEVVVVDKVTILKVAGTTRQFVLGDDPSFRPKDGQKTAFGKLQGALAGGSKRVEITGRLDGWNGHFPKFLAALPGTLAKDPAHPDKPATKKPLLIVTGFQVLEK
jgi:hypothetical protein